MQNAPGLDRPNLEAVADREIVRSIAAEQRALVTNDVLDFQLIHNQMLAAGEEHYGLIFTSDSTMPRNKASIPLWVKSLEKVLTEHQADDALKNRVRHLDVDEHALDAARRELGTYGLSETVNAALRDAARRRVLKGFDVVRDVDGTPQEVAAGRERS